MHVCLCLHVCWLIINGLLLSWIWSACSFLSMNLSDKLHPLIFCIIYVSYAVRGLNNSIFFPFFFFNEKGKVLDEMALLCHGYRSTPLQRAAWSAPIHTRVPRHKPVLCGEMAFCSWDNRSYRDGIREETAWNEQSRYLEKWVQKGLPDQGICSCSWSWRTLAQVLRKVQNWFPSPTFL